MTSKPNNFGMAIGACIMTIALFLAYDHHSAESVFTAVMFGVSAFGIMLILLDLPALAIDVAYSFKMSAQHVYDAWKLTQTYQEVKKGHIPDTPTATVDNSAEALRAKAWRDFWIDCGKEIEAHDGTVAYNVKNGWGMSALVDYEHWHSAIIVPFTPMGWIGTVSGGVKTKLLVPITFILNELSANRLPKLPYGNPPKLEAQTENAEAVYA